MYARGFGGGADGAVGRTLFAGEPITIIEHETHANGSRPLDSGAGHRLLVTRRGAALLRRRSELGGALAAEPLQSLVLERGVAYALEAGDAGHAFTLFAFTGAASSTVSPRVEPEVADGAPALSALLDMHLLMGFHRLRRTLGAGGADHDRSTAVELEALALLSGVCERYRRRLISSPRIVRRYRLHARRRVDVVERARCTLASAPADVHALDELSARLGVSTSQLAHVFPQKTGLSPHQYLLHLRAALALGQLSAGAGDLSRLALELGFATHSHFSAAFRRCMGMPPSKARQALAARGCLTRPSVAWNSSPVRCAYV